MSALTLAFAENIFNHQPQNDHEQDEAALHYLTDNDVFPPLNDTHVNAYEVVKDDVVFSEGSTVWVNKRSYAQAAETGGVVHEPIAVFNASSTPTAISSTVPIPAVRPSTTQQHVYDYYEGDEDGYLDDVYYQVKTTSTRKANGDQLAFARQLKQKETIYRCQLQQTLQQFSEDAIAMQKTTTDAIQKTQDTIDGFRKIAAYLQAPHFKTDLPPHWYFNGSIDECHKNFERRIFQAYNEDENLAGVKSAWEQVELRFNKPRPYNNANRLHRSIWYAYHNDMLWLIENTLIPELEDKVGQLDLDRNKTRKQRLWLIRSSIPTKKYLDPKVNRTNYALSILKEYESK
ncbi:hypothetical protein BDA99DRAFT_506553 [Phascolomyces articulosus]|uniref:Uncharacterized protein n=1 Tax=Phascolomyces articulosus TaxID=60185 RepID=A0AAD5KHF2_9FUNG|nr:hypothetical protein BDA99DRAFT_506553 [Phascolomyces articulosus]